MSIRVATKNLLVIILSLLPLYVMAAISGPDSTAIRAVKINRDLKLTGRLTDPLWSDARKVSLKYEVKPNDNKRALQKTWAMVLYNKSMLYVGFISKDTDPSKIRAHITDRDNISGDDYVGFMIDPYNNNQTAFGYFVNPDGIQMDERGNAVQMGFGNGYHDKSYNALWYSKAAVNDTGYTAVLAIPFKSLSFPNKEIQSWSVQFVRNYPRTNDYEFDWTHINLNQSCQLCQNGRLTNLQDVKNHNTIEFLPYVIATKSSALNNTDKPASGFNNGPIIPRAGGSISYSPTSSLSLNAVFNPDFSQVETDATQISVNNTFAISYPEKRPFFMKGASLFHTHMKLFHSRIISDPLLAGKATEKSGNFTLAYLTAYDRNVGYIIPGLLGSDVVESNLHSYTNILRPRYNFGSDSDIGGMFTTRNVGESHNYVGSIDWNLKIIDHYYFSGEYAYTHTKELNDTSLTSGIVRAFGHSQYDAAFNGQQYGGNGLQLEFRRRAKYYKFRLGYHGYSPTFQAQNGFITNTNVRQFSFNQEIAYYPSNNKLDNGNFSFSGLVQYDYSGLVMSKNLSLFLFNQFTHQTGVFMGYDIVNDQRYNNKMFNDLRQFHIGMHSNPTNYFSFGGHISTGTYIYHEDATRGKGFNLSLGVRIKPTPRLNLNLSYDFSKLSSAKSGQLYYSGDITRLEGMYNFTKRLFVRMIGQYNSFNKQIQVYPLVYYKVNPFTIFYAGMTNYSQDFGSPYGYQATNREFFIKFQYLIRK
jgi:hypothetical protein